MELEPTLDAEEPDLLEVLKETALLPIRIALSKRALKTYLSTILLILTAFILYLIAAAAYIYFYYNYIPNTAFTIPIYLQFDHPTPVPDLDILPYHPQAVSGMTSLGSFASLLVSQQKYDFAIHLTFPRTPSNIAAGNFMLILSLLGPTAKKTPTSPFSPDFPTTTNTTDAFPILARSSRPASLTYVSRHIDLAHKALALPMYLTGFKDETEALTVSMMEAVSFERGWRNIPKALAVEVKSRERLQIYDAQVSVRARLSGVRWFMRRYRVLSFVVFSSAFWVVEMVTCVGIWAGIMLGLSFLGEKSNEVEGKRLQTVTHTGLTEQRRVKQEEEEDEVDNMSDTERTFPTFAGQPPLRYTSPPKQVKQEEAEASPVGELPARGGEADVSAEDTDEDADFLFEEAGDGFKRRASGFDSGLGTSMDSSAGSSARRRRMGGERE